jgi:hypothetical protein
MAGMKWLQGTLTHAAVQTVQFSAESLWTFAPGLLQGVERGTTGPFAKLKRRVGQVDHRMILKLSDDHFALRLSFRP